MQCTKGDGDTELYEKLSFDPDLPISARRANIAAAIRDHQVVIVCGETGSGKSTQLPKICLEMGRGAAGLIGHTQPRRIAAPGDGEAAGADRGVGADTRSLAVSRFSRNLSGN